MNWTLQVLSHNLVFLFHLISLGKLTSIPLLNMHLKSSVSSPEPRVFLIFSPSNYVQVSSLSFSRIMLPRLEWCSNKIYSLSSRQSPVQSHFSHQQSQPRQISPISFPSSLSRRPFHILRMLSRAWLSGGQGYYSCSAEACRKHQKLNSFTPFPSFTAKSTKSTPQVTIRPKNVEFMESLAFSLS